MLQDLLCVHRGQMLRLLGGCLCTTDVWACAMVSTVATLPSDSGIKPFIILFLMYIRRIKEYCHLLYYLREWIVEPKWLDLDLELSTYKMWYLGHISLHLHVSYSCKMIKITPHKIILRIIWVIIHKHFKHCLSCSKIYVVLIMMIILCPLILYHDVSSNSGVL